MSGHMSTVEPAPEPQTVEHASGHLPDIGHLAEDHPARLFWKATAEGGDDVGAGRIDEYHNALRRHLRWLRKPMTEAVEGARLGLRSVIEHEVKDPREAERQSQLIDLAAACYAEGM